MICNNLIAYSYIGKLYLEKGLIDKTIGICNKMLDIDPNNEEASVILYCLTNGEDLNLMN